MSTRPELSDVGAYRLTRFAVACMTLGRMMAICGNDKTDPDVKAADQQYERAEQMLRGYLAALERVADAELQLARIQAATWGVGGARDVSVMEER